MAELIKLDLRTSKGNQLVHKYYRHRKGLERLAVGLPGNHYGVDGPVLYHPLKYLRSSGWDTLAITYGFQSSGEEFTTGLFPDLIQECASAIEVCLSQRDYERVSLVGKSLEAMLAVQLCTSMPDLASSRVAYLTPPINTPFFDELFIQSTQMTYVAMGKADRFYSVEAVENLRSRREFEFTLIQGADHSLDIVGDWEATMEALKQVVEEVIKFIEAE